jgi:hypothetical protein
MIEISKVYFLFFCDFPLRRFVFSYNYAICGSGNLRFFGFSEKQRKKQVFAFGFFCGIYW